EQIGLGAEMAEVPVATLGLARHLHAHFGAVIAMERIALDIDGVDLLAMKDLLKCPLDRRGAGAGRTCDRDDRVLSGHGAFLDPKEAAMREQRRACAGADLGARMKLLDAPDLF